MTAASSALWQWRRAQRQRQPLLMGLPAGRAPSKEQLLKYATLLAATQIGFLI